MAPNVGDDGFAPLLPGSVGKKGYALQMHVFKGVVTGFTSPYSRRLEEIAQIPGESLSSLDLALHTQ
jgi:hypothetical protein